MLFVARFVTMFSGERGGGGGGGGGKPEKINSILPTKVSQILMDASSTKRTFLTFATTDLSGRGKHSLYNMRHCRHYEECLHQREFPNQSATV